MSDKPCTACPVEVRDLYATAQNLLYALDAEDAERIPGKIASLRRSVETMKGLVDQHFKAEHNTR
jgi:hypothetical protein